MFIIDYRLRIALIALFLIGGITMGVTISWGYASLFLIVGIILLVGYIMLGTVGSAAKFLQAQDFDGCEKRLKWTPNPSWLYATNRAMYYMMMGTISMQRKDNKAAEEYLKKAEQVEVPTDNEKAMLQLQLANVAAQKGNWSQVQMNLKTLKGLSVSEPMIKEQIKQLEMGMKNKGQLKQAGRMGITKEQMMAKNPGGKRRRPKMR